MSSPYFNQSLQETRNSEGGSQAQNLNGIPAKDFEEVSPKLDRRIMEIFDLYIRPGSIKEIDISSKDRKKLETELEFKNNHPDIWKPVFENIANLLRANSLEKFLNQK
jgi:hypothetical protein